MVTCVFFISGIHVSIETGGIFASSLPRHWTVLLAGRFHVPPLRKRRSPWLTPESVRLLTVAGGYLRKEHSYADHKQPHLLMKT